MELGEAILAIGAADRAPSVELFSVQPLCFPRPLLDLRFAVAGEVPQGADRLRRGAGRAHSPMLDELAKPYGVRHVGLAAGDVPQVARIEQPALEVVLEPGVRCSTRSSRAAR